MAVRNEVPALVGDAASNDVTSLPDSDLLRLISRGDLSAFETVYDRHIDAAWKVALAFSRDAAAAEQAVSAVFLRLWQTPEPGIDASLGARLLSSVRREAGRPRLVAVGDTH